MLEQSPFSPEFSPSSPTHSVNFWPCLYQNSTCIHLLFPFFDTLLTTPHAEFRICIKVWQAANFLLIKYDHLGVARLKKELIMGHNSELMLLKIIKIFQIHDSVLNWLQIVAINTKLQPEADQSLPAK